MHVRILMILKIVLVFIPQKEVNVQKEMEADANKKAVFLLNNQVKELEQKLQLEDAKTAHKVRFFFQLMCICVLYFDTEFIMAGI